MRLGIAMIGLVYGAHRGGAIEILAPEVISRIIEQGRSVGLSEQECSYWYNWIALGANKAMPHMSTYRELIHDGPFRTFEQDYRRRVPPHDDEVISLLMIRAGLEWLERLKEQGKL